MEELTGEQAPSYVALILTPDKTSFLIRTSQDVTTEIALSSLRSALAHLEKKVEDAYKDFYTKSGQYVANESDVKH